MLSFQNLHQVVFHLSQGISFGPVRVTSTSVRKEPDVDVECSKSFLNTLKVFQESEYLKAFHNLHDVKFGPQFNDVQWIFSKPINFKFTADKSVKELDLGFSHNKISLIGACNLDLEKSNNGKSYGRRQKNFLVNVEMYIMKNPTWGKTYVSGKSFNENKESSRCGYHGTQAQFNRTSPLLSSLVGKCVVNSFPSNVVSIQRRGFRTKRQIELDEKPGNKTFGGFLDETSKRSSESSWSNNFFDNWRIGKVSKNKATLARSYEETIKDESLSSKERERLRISFAEGYAVGQKFAAVSTYSKIVKFFSSLTGFVLSAFLLFLLVSLAKKSVFPFGFRPTEIIAENVDVTFNDVKGIEEVKDELHDIVEFLRNPTKFTELGGKLPKGILLIGPPGTGKTLLAKAVAGEANVPFFKTSGAEFDEVFVGEGARRVRTLFSIAKAKAPCIVFIDEIDGVGGKRKSTFLHPYANQTINQLLSEMDGFTANEGVIVLGATNRKEDLDPALLRRGRFDVEVTVPIPDYHGRKEILELYIGKISSRNIDIEKIAKDTIGTTGADLQTIVNHAAIKAAIEGAPYVTMAHLEYAKDKVQMGPERKLAIKDEESLRTAYHEGGHAVVGYFSGVGALNKVTILPRGQSLGHTSFIPEETQHHTKSMYMASIDTTLGGRAAEELVFGPDQISSGASDDLQKATLVATAMVKEFGMSEKVGLRIFSSPKSGKVPVNEYGQVVTDQVDLEIKRLIQESYERAKDILRKHSKEHKELAEALVKYKTLSPEDVEAILGKKKKAPSGTSAPTVTPN